MDLGLVEKAVAEDGSAAVSLVENALACMWLIITNYENTYLWQLSFAMRLYVYQVQTLTSWKGCSLNISWFKNTHACCKLTQGIRDPLYCLRQTRWFCSFPLSSNHQLPLRHIVCLMLNAGIIITHTVICVKMNLLNHLIICWESSQLYMVYLRELLWTWRGIFHFGFNFTWI